jgi:hypothetical protein
MAYMRRSDARSLKCCCEIRLRKDFGAASGLGTTEEDCGKLRQIALENKIAQWTVKCVDFTHFRLGRVPLSPTQSHPVQPVKPRQTSSEDSERTLAPPKLWRTRVEL